MTVSTEPRVVRDEDFVAQRLHETSALYRSGLTYGRRLDKRVMNGCQDVYLHFRKAYFVTKRTSGFLTSFDLAQAFYPGVMNGADAEKKHMTIRRHLRRLEAAGLIRIREHTTDNGQTLGLWWELVDEAPSPEAWPDFRDYGARLHQDGADRVRFRYEAPSTTERRREVCKLKRREKLRPSDPRRRVHRWCPRIGHGSEHRYDVVVELEPDPAFFSPEPFGSPTSLPAPVGTTSLGGRQAGEVRERRAPASFANQRGGHAPSPPSRQAQTTPEPGSMVCGRSWSALTRCRTAASERGAPAVLAVPRADWCSMAAAAFEARFVSENGDGWWNLGDPHHLERGVESIDADPELAAPEHRHRYITLSGPWARRLETWCRTYDRAVKEPGAGIRSLVHDIVDWAPADGAPGREPGTPGRKAYGAEAGGGWPVSLAFFVARLGRRAKDERRSGPSAKAKKRDRNRRDWDAGERW